MGLGRARQSPARRRVKTERICLQVKPGAQRLTRPTILRTASGLSLAAFRQTEKLQKIPTRLFISTRCGRGTVRAPGLGQRPARLNILIQTHRDISGQKFSFGENADHRGVVGAEG